MIAGACGMSTSEPASLKAVQEYLEGELQTHQDYLTEIQNNPTGDPDVDLLCVELETEYCEAAREALRALETGDFRIVVTWFWGHLTELSYVRRHFAQIIEKDVTGIIEEASGGADYGSSITKVYGLYETVRKELETQQ